jgi:hypothetical protein
MPLSGADTSPNPFAGHSGPKQPRWIVHGIIFTRRKTLPCGTAPLGATGALATGIIPAFSFRQRQKFRAGYLLFSEDQTTGASPMVRRQQNQEEGAPKKITRPPNDGASPSSSSIVIVERFLLSNSNMYTIDWFRSARSNEVHDGGRGEEECPRLSP